MRLHVIDPEYNDYLRYEPIRIQNGCSYSNNYFKHKNEKLRHKYSKIGNTSPKLVEKQGSSQQSVSVNSKIDELAISEIQEMLNGVLEKVPDVLADFKDDNVANEEDLRSKTDSLNDAASLISIISDLFKIEVNTINVKHKNISEQVKDIETKLEHFLAETTTEKSINNFATNTKVTDTSTKFSINTESSDNKENTSTSTPEASVETSPTNKETASLNALNSTVPEISSTTEDSLMELSTTKIIFENNKTMQSISENGTSTFSTESTSAFSTDQVSTGLGLTLETTSNVQSNTTTTLELTMTATTKIDSATSASPKYNASTNTPTPTTSNKTTGENTETINEESASSTSVMSVVTNTETLLSTESTTTVTNTKVNFAETTMEQTVDITNISGNDDKLSTLSASTSSTFNATTESTFTSQHSESLTLTSMASTEAETDLITSASETTSNSNSSTKSVINSTASTIATIEDEYSSITNTDRTVESTLPSLNINTKTAPKAETTTTAVSVESTSLITENITLTQINSATTAVTSEYASASTDISNKSTLSATESTLPILSIGSESTSKAKSTVTAASMENTTLIGESSSESISSKLPESEKESTLPILGIGTEPTAKTQAITTTSSLASTILTENKFLAQTTTITTDKSEFTSAMIENNSKSAIESTLSNSNVDYKSTFKPETIDISLSAASTLITEMLSLAENTEITTKENNTYSTVTDIMTIPVISETTVLTSESTINMFEEDKNTSLMTQASIGNHTVLTTELGTTRENLVDTISITANLDETTPVLNSLYTDDQSSPSTVSTTLSFKNASAYANLSTESSTSLVTAEGSAINITMLNITDLESTANTASTRDTTEAPGVINSIESNQSNNQNQNCDCSSSTNVYETELLNSYSLLNKILNIPERSRQDFWLMYAHELMDKEIRLIQKKIQFQILQNYKLRYDSYALTNSAARNAYSMLIDFVFHKNKEKRKKVENPIRLELSETYKKFPFIHALIESAYGSSVSNCDSFLDGQLAQLIAIGDVFSEINPLFNVLAKVIYYFLLFITFFRT